MRFFAEITRIDDEQRLVSGYAATEQRATDGLVVTRDALQGALDDYMEFANVREMHQPSAVGVTRQAEVNDGGLYITAEIVDEAAWEKVKRGVYKGFSIGAKVTERDPDDRTVVRGIQLREISVVDRPADPGAKIDLWHADDGYDPEDEELIRGADLDAAAGREGVYRRSEEADHALRRRAFSEEQRKKAAETGAAMPDGSYPIENRQDLENAIRAYGRAKNKRAVRRHIMKRARALGATDLIPEDWKTMKRSDGDTADQIDEQAEAVETAETETEAAGETPVEEASQEGESDADSTSRADEVEDDPVQRAVRAAEAATQRVDAAVQEADSLVSGHGPTRELPGADLRRGMSTVCRLNYLLSELAYLAMDAQWEADIEGDNSAVPGKLRGALVELAKAYKAMSDEELAELMNGVGVDVQIENGIIMLMAAGADLERFEGSDDRDATVSARLAQALAPFIDRGWELTPTPTAEPTEMLELRRTVESLTEDRETLLRTTQAMTERMDGMADQIKRFGEMVAPGRTAGAHAVRPIDKEADGAGAGVERIDAGEPTVEDVQRALDAMPKDRRVEVLMRAALANPLPVSGAR